MSSRPPSSLLAPVTPSVPDAPATRVPTRTWVWQVMGMPVSLRLRGLHSDDALDHLASSVLASLRQADEILSPFRADSDLSRLNRREIDLSTTHSDVQEVLALCAEAWHRTEGYFDATCPRDGDTPLLDPCGLVKGWAVERAARLLDGQSRLDYCLNAGGDIAVRTCEPGSAGWRIGIENPLDRQRLVDVLEVSTGAVATSGTAARGAHILDPFTGRPPCGLASVTLVGPSLMWADVYATAAFARGTGAFRWLAGLDGYSSLVVDDTGHVHRFRGTQQRPQAVPAAGLR